jgi:peptide/nickel transport system substrate-binding protein
MLVETTAAANIRPGAFNTANWTTADVEAAGKQLEASSDKAVRWQAVKTILTAIANDLPYIPLQAPDHVLAVGGGFSLTQNMSILDLENNGAWPEYLQAN